MRELAAKLGENDQTIMKTKFSGTRTLISLLANAAVSTITRATAECGQERPFSEREICQLNGRSPPST